MGLEDTRATYGDFKILVIKTNQSTLMICKNGSSLINTKFSIGSIQYYICFIFDRYNIILSTNILTTKKILFQIFHQYFA